MDKCPGLIGGVNDPSTSCNIQCPIDEQVEGVLAKLPGKNPLGQWGVPVGGSTPSSTAAPAGLSAPVSSVQNGVTTSPASDPSDATTVTPTTAVTALSESTTVIPTTVVPAASESTTAAPTEPATLVTSYVSLTTLIVTTVTLPAPSASGTSSPVAAGWSYDGCFSDNLNSRVLTGIEFANIGNHEVTNTKCVAYCAAAGYSMAGTEYGGQCFCGNELSGSSAVAGSQCNMPCEGDSTQTCGGSLTLSVYTRSGTSRRQARNIPQRIRTAWD
jgi:hypothetical protein